MALSVGTHALLSNIFESYICAELQSFITELVEQAIVVKWWYWISDYAVD